MTEKKYLPSTWGVAADHVERYLATNGKDGFEFNGAKCIVLTTFGRKSGAIRRSPLIRVTDGDRYLAVASMGGAPKHPSWYLNLLENPNVTIQDRAKIYQMIARTATSEEKEELWPKAVTEWPDYENYQNKTKRDIPLVICEQI